MGLSKAEDTPENLISEISIPEISIPETVHDTYKNKNFWNKISKFYFGNFLYDT